MLSGCEKTAIHAQSKSGDSATELSLPPVFPRGNTPDAVGRFRNNEVNQIPKTYGDHKTVYWLDIDHVFIEENGNMKRDLIPDGLHPNEVGYYFWAKAMEPIIRKIRGEDDKG